MLSPGGLIFSASSLSQVFIAPAETPQNFTPWPLAAESSPLGAKWGQASGVILRFSERREPPLGAWVGLPREDLPELAPGEFYVADVIGFDVLDENGTSYGRLEGYADVAPTLGGAVNLSVKTPQGKIFEFPAAWVDIDAAKMEARQIHVPNLAEWAQLDPREPSDEKDERPSRTIPEENSGDE